MGNKSFSDTEGTATITSEKETPYQMLEIYTVWNFAPVKYNSAAAPSSLNMTKTVEKEEEANFASFQRRVVEASQNELEAQRKSFDNQIACLEKDLVASREEQQIMKREHQNTKTALVKVTNDLDGLRQMHNKGVEEFGNRMGEVEQELAQQKTACKAGLLKQLDYLRQLAQVIAGVEDSSSSEKRKRDSVQEERDDNKRQ
ncbi:uncharacterized protein FIESC28_01619 [Fusarium coffeatum]|uniref:Uncharacterized protein n=1 Tax=Fusarium coffeatum TaxID=231269 RepID=A0A366SAE4_9HYPO|nr:uncharacterized protein FIESC28_01619 [Fusarium coffeatum]RBR25656.1 hypothetical protein FIESC28_01619 [Fusarium coffeatum]